MRDGCALDATAALHFDEKTEIQDKQRGDMLEERGGLLELDHRDYDYEEDHYTNYEVNDPPYKDVDADEENQYLWNKLHLIP